jgi:tRNA(adenine34) deaminase
MEEAIKQSEIALKLKEVPVGAVIVKDERIIATAYNLKETLKDATAHAEILAIRKASDLLQNWRLSGCDMYVTLEPCPMCAAAIAQARIRNVYIGTFDQDTGACGTVIDIAKNEYLKYRVNVYWMYNERCSRIITEFFKNRRTSMEKGEKYSY